MHFHPLTRVRQKLSALALAYATYLLWHCPCAKIMSCHKTPFLLSTGVALSIVAYDYV